MALGLDSFRAPLSMRFLKQRPPPEERAPVQPIWGAPVTCAWQEPAEWGARSESAEWGAR